MRGTRSLFVLGALLSLASAALTGCGDSGGGGPLGGGGGVVGRYEMDKAGMKDMMTKMAKENAGDMPAEAAEMMNKQMDEMIKGMKMTMEVKGDKTWEMTMDMSIMGQQKHATAKGTWSQSGDQVTFTATEEDGKPAKKENASKAATFSGNSLTIEEGPMKVVLKKV